MDQEKSFDQNHWSSSIGTDDIIIILLQSLGPLHAVTPEFYFYDNEGAISCDICEGAQENGRSCEHLWEVVGNSHSSSKSHFVRVFMVPNRCENGPPFAVVTRSHGEPCHLSREKFEARKSKTNSNCCNYCAVTNVHILSCIVPHVST